LSTRPYVFFVPEEMKDRVGQEYEDELTDDHLSILQEWFINTEFEVEPIEGDIIQCVWEEYRNTGTYILLERNLSELSHVPDDYGCIPYSLTCPDKFPVPYFKDVIVHNDFVNPLRTLRDQFRENLTPGRCDQYQCEDGSDYDLNECPLYSWADYNGQRYWLLVEQDDSDRDPMELYEAMYRNCSLFFACDSNFNSGLYDPLEPNLFFVYISRYHADYVDETP
jgi:hypothetical protein